MFKKEKFTDRLFASYILLVGIILLLAFFLFYITLVSRTSEAITNTIYTSSIQLSKSQTIREAFKDKKVSDELSDYLDEMIESEKYIDYIVLADNDHLRLYHPNKSFIGERFNGGDEDDALNGKASYISEEKGTSEYQRRCFSTVYGENNNILGFVMVSCYTKSINAMYQKELLRFFGLFLISLLLASLFSKIYANNLKQDLLGYEPAHIAELFQQREDILNSLNEGLILLDNQNNSVFYNDTVKKLFKTDNNEEITKIIEKDINKSSHDKIDQIQIKQNDTALLMNIGPIYHNDNQVGKLVLLNDMTNFQRQAEELTGIKHIVEALRATTHEQKNRLHIILGLLQLGETDEAIKYITDSVNQENKNNDIINKIENKTIAALILGKINRAKELDIDFILDEGSYLEENNDCLSNEDLVTIIGNLVENAFDALVNREDEKKVRLFINSSKEALIIRCNDNGEGMKDDVKDLIMNSNYTSKGEGHGTGLRLIKNIINRCNGKIDIESTYKEGSTFTIKIKK